MSFSLSIYPFVYKAHYQSNSVWTEEIEEKPHLSPAEEEGLPSEELNKLKAQRNSFPDLPLVNYTTQYGMGCFEGIKAFPQPDGSLKIFRLDENAARMKRSMEGLLMPGFPEDLFIQAVKTIVGKNRDLGFAPRYDKTWEEKDFTEGHAVYVRPFSYSEPAIGLGISQNPSVVMITTPVGSYFREGTTAAVTTERVRATHKGTGWIKCDSNYVIPILAKKEAEAAGYMEAIFLDAEKKTFLEEGSSCNIFFLLKSGRLVTPSLGDTILPGITRKSVITLAADSGLDVEERPISIDEVLSDAVECFVTGTAAGIAPLESITHRGKTAQFTPCGEVSLRLRKTLKGIQYGAIEDKYNWMFTV